MTAREIVIALFDDYSLCEKPERMTPYEAIYQSNAMQETDAIAIRPAVLYSIWNQLVKEGSYSND
jgi:hypothetical protein